LVKGGDDASDLAFFFRWGVLLDAISTSNLAPLGVFLQPLKGIAEEMTVANDTLTFELGGRVAIEKFDSLAKRPV
jgi:hypothetical protein